MRAYRRLCPMVLSCASTVALSQVVGITGVGVQPGGTGSGVSAISADGNVALVPQIPGFVWTRTSASGGNLVALPNDGAEYTYSPRAVSGNGLTIFGNGYYHAVGQTSTRAVRWRYPFQSMDVLNGTGSASSCSG